MQRCLTDSYIPDGPASIHGFPHLYLTSQFCWTLGIKRCSHLDALGSSIFLPMAYICMFECMCLVISMVIRWLGIAESAQINSFLTISIAPIKSCWHCIIHTWTVFQGITLRTWILFLFLFPSHWQYSGLVWQLNIVLLLSSGWYCYVLIATQSKW